MSRVLTSAAIIFAAGSIANAQFAHHDLIVNPGGQALLGPDYVTFDLIVTIIGDDWAGSSAEATLTEGTFYIEPSLGNGKDPMAYAWAWLPELEWSSWYTSTLPNYPNPSFAGEVISSPTFRSATWFEAPPNGGEGTFVIARYTIFAPDWDGTYSLGTLSGYSELADTIILPQSFEFEFIPAPGSLALLGLAGLIGRRRLAVH